MINLLYCANARAFDGIITSCLSISKNTKEALNIFIMTMDLTDVDANNKPVTEEMAQIIENSVRRSNDESRVIIVDVETLYRKMMLGGANEKTSYTPYTLIRLLADDIPTIPSKILYLDTDTLSHSDISELYDIDITDYEIGGVVDYLGKTFIKKDYINAGVLLLNMDKIRADGLFKSARRLCKYKKMKFPDQDALNKSLRSKKILDTRFNEQHKLRENTVIQHFSKTIRWVPFFHTLNIKPWQVDLVHEKLGIYDYDDVLDEYLQIKSENEGL